MESWPNAKVIQDFNLAQKKINSQKPTGECCTRAALPINISKEKAYCVLKAEPVLKLFVDYEWCYI